ncbi:DUF1007 family protein [Aurantimonas sp. VKM B-3413]|uniref:DUF1007 family protein n=1 Tax=Aurantimonas sp. VKM B-3413 TaxID=2779401 RepID=UPI001E48990C|nr:DUF1007 family protein [Aurantimonas sp. VKM B-3413]MCB8838177.1 DUF1007 family protein [Aurantimonas sp. VKM B-3413]
MRGIGAFGVLAAALVALSTGAASAHPHVFVDAKMEIIGDGHGRLAEIRNIWSMDELFSASVIPDFDADGNGRLDKPELEAVGKQVESSIAEWSYYTFVSRGAEDIAMQPPSTFDVTYDAKKGKLLFVFTMKPKSEVDLTKEAITFSVYDKTYFVAFNFPDESHFIEKNLPVLCKKAFVVPSPDEAATRWMNSIARFNSDQTVPMPEDGVDFSKVLATRLELDCR